jgi:hypothetical protein
MSYQNPLYLSVEDIRDITRYNHYIPFVRGFHQEFISQRFPGWSWNQLLPRLVGSKIVRTHNDCSDCTRLAMGLCMDSDIEGVWMKSNPSGVRVKAVRKVTQQAIEGMQLSEGLNNL